MNNTNLEMFSFETPKDRPFIYASFVQTIDGKIMVKEKGYWPIGTEEDFRHFTTLRAHADAIIDAKNTAITFAKYTIKTIHDSSFIKDRLRLNRKEKPEYIVLTSNPDADLISKLENSYDFKTTILTTSNNATQNKNINIVSLNSNNQMVSITQLIEYLKFKNHRYVYVDGGPSLITELVKNNVLDEIHITIAPKFFGGLNGKTVTLGEGGIVSKNNIPQFILKNYKIVGNEVILRYKRKKSELNPV